MFSKKWLWKWYSIHRNKKCISGTTEAINAGDSVYAVVLTDKNGNSKVVKSIVEVQNAIENLKGEYTILIVAHRLSTIIDCDKIFIVDGGKIIDSGSHEELLKRCEFYRNLYEKDLNG